MNQPLFRVLVATWIIAVLATHAYSTEGGLNSKFDEDSRWVGIATQYSSDGTQGTYDVELRVTERNLDKFKGEYRAVGGAFALEVEGTIKQKNGIEKVNFKFVRILSQKNDLKNIIGVELRGDLRAKKKTRATALDLRFDWPKSDGKNINTTGKVELTLDE